MDKPKRITAQCDYGRCTKQFRQRMYSKKRRNLNKSKKVTSESLVRKSRYRETCRNYSTSDKCEQIIRTLQSLLQYQLINLS